VDELIEREQRKQEEEEKEEQAEAQNIVASILDRWRNQSLTFSSLFFPSLSLFSRLQPTGISLRTQELYTLVFVCRYLDLFTRYGRREEEERKKKEEQEQRIDDDDDDDDDDALLAFASSFRPPLTCSLSLSLCFPPPKPNHTPIFSYISLYNSLMKLVFLASSAAILYLMRGAKGIKQTYDASHDTFRVAFLVAPAAVLAFSMSADRSSAMETAWTFSILLEAVAILPQLVLLQRTGNVDNLTGDYVFLLGTYRAFYVVNWFYRWMTEPGYKQWLGERGRGWLFLGSLETERWKWGCLEFPFSFLFRLFSLTFLSLFSFSLSPRKKKTISPNQSPPVWISGTLQTGLYLDFFYFYLRAWRNNEKLSLPS